MRAWRHGLILLMLVMVISACQGTRIRTTPTPELVVLDFYATSATIPLLEDLTQTYIRQDVLFVIRLHETTWYGLQRQIRADASTYGMTTYLPDDSDLWAAPVGEDGIAIIVHPDVAIASLTASQLRGLLTGAITNWQTIGGADLPVQVVSYGDGSAVRLAFARLVLGDRPITPAARLAPTAPSMLDIVATTPGAIGYLSYGMLDRRVRVVPVAATAEDTPIFPSRVTLSEGLYPLRMPLLVVGQQPPPTGSAIYQFFLWMQQGSGQQIIERRYLPLSSP